MADRPLSTLGEPSFPILQFSWRSQSEIEAFLDAYLPMLEAKYGGSSSFKIIKAATLAEAECALQSFNLVQLHIDSSSSIFLNPFLTPLPYMVSVNSLNDVRVGVPLDDSLAGPLAGLPTTVCSRGYLRNNEIYLIRLKDLLDFHTFPRFQEVKSILVPWKGQHFFFVSHRWQSLHHPDPEGKTMKMLRLRRFEELDCRHFDGFVRFGGVTLSPKYRGYEACFAEDSLVWLDFTCLPQFPRSAADKADFERMFDLVKFHQVNMTVLRCYVSDDWKGRGWCAMENFFALICGYDACVRSFNSRVGQGKPDVQLPEPDSDVLMAALKTPERFHDILISGTLGHCMFRSETDRHVAERAIRAAADTLLADIRAAESTTSTQHLVLPFKTYHGAECSHCTGTVITLNNISHLRLDAPGVSFEQMVSQFQEQSAGYSQAQGDFSDTSRVKRLFLQDCCAIDTSRKVILSPMDADCLWAVRVDPKSFKLLSWCVPADVTVTSNIPVVYRPREHSAAVPPKGTPRGRFALERRVSFPMESEQALYPCIQTPSGIHPEHLEGAACHRYVLAKKEEGNTAYRAGNWAAALAAYSLARGRIQDIGDFLSASDRAVLQCQIYGNRASAMISNKEYQRAVRECIIALFYGETHAAPSLRAKLWARMGRALVSGGLSDAAIEPFKQSLAIEEDAEVRAALGAC